MPSTPKSTTALLLLGILFTSACQTPPSSPAVTVSDSSEVFPLSDVNEPPKTVSMARPYFPDHLRGSRSESCVVRFVVNTEGRVVNVTVVKSTSKEWSNAAVQAVSSWRYKPAKKDGRPVNCVLQIPLLFNEG
ncbi:MAG: energy transducer TonB [Nibricoccus sp.]